MPHTGCTINVWGVNCVSLTPLLFKTDKHFIFWIEIFSNINKTNQNREKPHAHERLNKQGTIWWSSKWMLSGFWRIQYCGNLQRSILIGWIFCSRAPLPETSCYPHTAARNHLPVSETFCENCAFQLHTVRFPDPKCKCRRYIYLIWSFCLYLSKFRVQWEKGQWLVSSLGKDIWIYR